jgi:processive 1,2-diacylglycerol beta-glucosyltransferase
MDKLSKDKILILSAYTFGDGHKQVANAIKEAINMEFTNIEPVIIDIMTLTHPYAKNLSGLFYKLVIKNFPSIYSYLYKKTRLKSSFSEKIKLPLLFGMHSLLNVIHLTKPVAIVCTHPFAAGIVSNLKERRNIDIPNITIITDYTNHSYWTYPYTDVYIVPSNQIRIQLMELGIEHKKIYATGIPIRRRFDKMYSREALALKYGLDPTIFTLLIMGGGDGFIGREISLIASHCNTIQVIIVCGRNKRLEKILKIRYKSFHPQPIVIGYCENIEELMAISDLIISKPGGVTTSEALAMNLPLIIYKPLPGQEEDNKNYLLHAELAFFAQNQQDLLKQVLEISKNADVLLEMKQKYQCLPNKSSTIKALNIILLEINRSKIISLLITAATMKMVL